MKWTRRARRWKEGEDLPLMCFAVLAALAKRPQSVRQMSRALQTHIDAVAKSLKVLEQLGWVVQRADRRWAIRVILAPMAIPLPNSLGQPPQRAHATQGTTPVLGKGLITAYNEAPDLTQSRSRYSEPVVTQTPEERAEKLAKSWNLPMTIEGLGMIGLGKLANCSQCHNRKTPLQYGGKTICANCARPKEENSV